MADTKQSDNNQDSTKQTLKERLKELECLYSITSLNADNDLTLEKLLQSVVEKIPPGFQYPDMVCAQICYLGRSFKSKNFRKTKWRLAFSLRAQRSHVGSIEVCYHQKPVHNIDDPFLSEEIDLMMSISNHIGAIIENKLTEKELFFLKNAIDSSLSGIAFTDMKNNITYINASFLKMWGFDNEDEVLGRNSVEFWKSKSGARQVIAEMTKKESWTGDLEALKKGGTVFDAHLAANMALDRSGNPVGKMACIHDISEKNRAITELIRSQQKLRGLAEHLQTLREEERGRMASKIHSDLGQILTVLKMDLSLLSQKVSGKQKELLALIKEIKETINRTIQLVQKISTELRPLLIDEIGFIKAVKWQVNEFQKYSGVKCELKILDKDIIPDKKTSIILFRILQEALTNVARHAMSTIVTVELNTKPGEIALKIEDDGKGISKGQISRATSFGILGIKESVLSLSGKVEIKGIPEKGTTVKVRLPIKK